MRPPVWLPVRAAALALFAVMALGVTAGCGDDRSRSDGGPAASPTSPASGRTPDAGGPSPTSSPTPDVELIEFEISGGVADPPLQRVTVERGTTVRIVVRSDEVDEVHLHEYDHRAEVGPGEDGVIEFVADIPGLFELETHHSEIILLQLAVR